MATKNYASKVIKVAKSENGYLEKRSNAYLNNKTKNAGDKNYTKYGAWYGLNPAYWCAEYISWIFNEAYGDCKLIYGKSASCEHIRQAFIKHGRYGSTPKVGALVFFKGSRHAGANHIAIVTAVGNGYFYTMEGNTSSDAGVVDNGGSVNNKCYKIGYSKVLGFGYPTYDAEPKAATAKPKQVTSANSAKVIASALNVRKQPSVLAGKCTFSPLKKGAVVKIVTAQKGWYLIEYKGKRGYVSSKYIKKV